MNEDENKGRYESSRVENIYTLRIPRMIYVIWAVDGVQDKSASMFPLKSRFRLHMLCRYAYSARGPRFPGPFYWSSIHYSA